MVMSMVSVETEVNKHRNCKDRDELGRLIKGYKELALKHGSNIAVAGAYSMVAHKLQLICDKLPAPRLRSVSDSSHNAPAKKTAAINDEENAKINAAWKQRTEGKDDKN